MPGDSCSPFSPLSPHSPTRPGGVSTVPVTIFTRVRCAASALSLPPVFLGSSFCFSVVLAAPSPSGFQPGPQSRRGDPGRSRERPALREPPGSCPGTLARRPAELGAPCPALGPCHPELPRLGFASPPAQPPSFPCRQRPNPSLAPRPCAHGEQIRSRQTQPLAQLCQSSAPPGSPWNGRAGKGRRKAGEREAKVAAQAEGEGCERSGEIGDRQGQGRGHPRCHIDVRCPGAAGTRREAPRGPQDDPGSLVMAWTGRCPRSLPRPRSCPRSPGATRMRSCS